MTDEWLTMSALNATRVILESEDASPGISRHDHIEILRGVEVTSTFDYGAAIEILNLVQQDLRGRTAKEVYRCIIAKILHNVIPKWCEKAHLGRDIINPRIPDQIRQCLNPADLFSEEDDCAAWWADLSRASRERFDKAKKEKGNRAEVLSMRREAEYLKQIAVTERPRRRSVFNEGLGFDISSFRRIGMNLREVLIEVKGCATKDLYFFVTRNEWTKALNNPDTYLFHIWNLEKEELREASVSEIAPSIPIDAGHGEWKTALLNLK